MALNAQPCYAHLSYDVATQNSAQLVMFLGYNLHNWSDAGKSQVACLVGKRPTPHFIVTIGGSLEITAGWHRICQNEVCSTSSCPFHFFSSPNPERTSV